MRIAWTLLCALILAGCSNDAATSKKPAPADDTQVSQPVADTKDPLYDQLHSGLFQSDAAVKKLADTLDAARELKDKATGDYAVAMKNVVDTIDDAGSSLAALSGGDAPTEEQVKANRAKFLALRDDLVNKIGDILKDMREQEDAAADMADSGTPAMHKPAKRLDDLLNEVIDDLRGALAALGGKDEASQGAPDTGDTNQKPPPGFDPNSAATG